MLEPVLVQLQKAYPKDVRLVSRYFPLSIHDKAIIAAQAAEAAGKQGKYFEMAEAIFAGQKDWAQGTPDDFQKWAQAQAKQLGLNVDQLTKDMNSDEVKQKVLASQADATRIGLQGTPSLFINGLPYNGGPRDFKSLESIVKLFQIEDKQFTECPPMSIDTSKKYTATIKTTKGDIVMELYPDKAPFAVNSFIFLANKGWFDNNIFHRVIPGFVAQTGDPSGSGYGGPGYAYSNEIAADSRFDKPGIVGMANAGPDSNGSQFFVTFAPASNLDGRYTIFGQVIQGMDVLQKLTPRDASSGGDLPDGDKIISVSIEEK